ncbi:MAG TPA: L,D-transpeptidase family protein [Candidatus Cybelea sp.]|nr:L,D-transpeptidase family protein [Candidatus Cybelea sp.]
MIHAIFNRPSGMLKVYEPGKSLWDSIQAGGDAVGNDPRNAPWGFHYPCPPGHYVLSAGIKNTDPDVVIKEGPYRIPVWDIDAATLKTLTDAGVASGPPNAVNVGGIVLPIGEIAANGRDGILIHGGGTYLHKLNPPKDQEPFQPLCQTEGCTRVHNADLIRLVDYLAPLFDGNTVVYTVYGNPLRLPH